MRCVQANRLVGFSFGVFVPCLLALGGCGSNPNSAGRLPDAERDTLCKQGTGLLDAGDFDTAIACFDRVVAAEPNHAPATLARGRALLAMGQPRRALEDFDRHIETLTSSRDTSQANRLADAYLYRGEAYAALDEWQRAIEDYSRALHLNPAADNAYRRRGQAYARMAAHPTRHVVLKAGPADAADSQPRLESNDLQANARGSVNAHLSREYCYTAAIRDFTQLVTKNPKDAEAFVDRGRTHAAEGWMYPAIADFTAAIDARGDYAPAYLQRGMGYATRQTQDDLKLAIADYDTSIRLDPKYAEAFYQRGLAHAGLFGFTETTDLAVRDFTEAIKWKPDYFEALLARGELYDKLGDYPKAIADLQRAVEINAQSAEAFFVLGFALIHGDRMPEASEPFERAVTLDPTYLAKLDGYYNQGKPVIGAVLPPGQLYCAKGRLHVADSDTARRAGDAKRADELLDVAMGYLNAAKLEDPTDPEPHYWLGEVYVRRGQTDQAGECFNQAAQLDDEHFDAHLAWGKLLVGRGGEQDYAVAAEFLGRAIRRHSESAEAHLFLARACLGDYRREQAFKAAELGETPPDTRLDEAIANYREAARLDAELVDEIALELAETLRIQAQAYATRGQWDKAIEAVTTALVYEPDQPSNYLLRATYRTRAGKVDSACKDYEEAFARGLTPPQADTWPRIIKDLVIRKARDEIGRDQLRAAVDKARTAEKLEKQIKQAADELERVAAEMPASLAQLYVDIGRRYLEDRQFKLAIAPFNAAITWDTANADAYRNRGIAISRLDKPVLWEDVEWKFAGWPPEIDMPQDWMPNALPLAREIAWNRKWEAEWTEAWKKAWQADLDEAVRLSSGYGTKLDDLINDSTPGRPLGSGASGLDANEDK